MTNAALYIRVSTLEQAQTGYSLEAQERKLRDYSEYQKYNIVDVYIDDGYSGASLARPALTRLINDVKAGKVDVVLIYKLDRLSRKVKNVLELVDLFIEKKVQLYSLTEQLDLSSSFGRAALKMSATFSELERETIIERTKMGKDQAAKNGKYMGSPGFGYRRNLKTKSFEVIPEEAEIVQKLFSLYIGGYTFRQLYEYAKENYKLPYFNNFMCCRPIINRMIYSGYFNYKDNLYKAVNVPPIIDYETYLRAHAQVEKNKTLRRHESSPYLLTGLVYCGVCGNRFVGKLSEQKYVAKDGTDKPRLYYNYGCAARIKRDKNYHPAKCDNDIIAAGKLESFVEEAMRHLKFDKFVSGKASNGVIDKLIGENAKLKEQLDRLLDVFLDGLIDKDTYSEKTTKISKQIDKNNDVIQSEQEKTVATPTETIDYVREQYENYPNLSHSEKRKFLALIINKIIIKPGEIVIKWYVS